MTWRAQSGPKGIRGDYRAWAAAASTRTHFARALCVLPCASTAPEALAPARVDARVALLRASGHALHAVRTLLACGRWDDAVGLLDAAIAAAASSDAGPAAAAAAASAGAAAGEEPAPPAAGARTPARGGILATEAAAEAARAASADATAARTRMAAVENASFAAGAGSAGRRGARHAGAASALGVAAARPWTAEAALVCALFHEVLKHAAAAADSARLASLWPRRPATYGLWSMLAALRGAAAPPPAVRGGLERRGSVGSSGVGAGGPQHPRDCPVRGERGTHLLLGDVLPQFTALSAEAVREAGAISSHWRERGLSLQGRGAVLRDFAGSPAWR